MVYLSSSFFWVSYFKSVTYISGTGAFRRNTTRKLSFIPKTCRPIHHVRLQVFKRPVGIAFQTEWQNFKVRCDLKKHHIFWGDINMPSQKGNMNKPKVREDKGSSRGSRIIMKVMLSLRYQVQESLRDTRLR